MTMRFFMRLARVIARNAALSSGRATSPIQSLGSWPRGVSRIADHKVESGRLTALVAQPRNSLPYNVHLDYVSAGIGRSGQSQIDDTLAPLQQWLAKPC